MTEPTTKPSPAPVPTIHPVSTGHVLVTPPGHEVHDLDDVLAAHLPNTRRPKGRSFHHTLDSLIEHAKRHKTPESAAFCELAAGGAAAKLVAVYNYHPKAGAPAVGGWGDFRAGYDFPLSEAWQRWTKAAQGPLSVEQFAVLLEDRFADLREPVDGDPTLPGVRYASPAELLMLAEGLTVRVGQTVQECKRLDNGTAQMTFAEEHSAKNARGEPIRVPNGFLLGIPVFVGGEAYAVRVRLRYRVANGQVAWQLVLHDAEGCRRDAIREAADRFKTATELPLYFGTPD